MGDDMDNGRVSATCRAVPGSEPGFRRGLASSLRFLCMSLVLPAIVAVLSGCEDAAEAEVLPRRASRAIDRAAFAANTRTGHGNRQHTVYLRVDGNLTGRVSRFLSSGAFVPAQARVRLMREASVAASARSDDDGSFEIVGLEPAVYWVIADGLEGCTAFSVRVLPVDISVTEERMWLHMTLVPCSTMGQLANDPVAEREMQPPTPPVCPMAPVRAGGGGAGAALAGSAGLAGLAGISGDASPARP